MPDFVSTERKVLQIFRDNIGRKIDLHGITYLIGDLVGKPRPNGGGECKTDCFVELINSEANTVQYLKISIKQPNADFTGNKISAEIAENEFGANWSKVIFDHTCSIKEKFFNRKLIFYQKCARVDAGSITLGWRFELMNKSSGELSGKINVNRLSHYSGDKLSINKRNSLIEGREVTDSGVANIMLECFGKEVNSLSEVVDKLTSIEDYANRMPDLYFACKALNCRTLHSKPFKYDGDRPLCVQVYWEANSSEKKLVPYILFNSPLQINGKAMRYALVTALRKLGCNNTNQIEKNGINVENPIFRRWDLSR